MHRRLSRRSASPPLPALARAPALAVGTDLVEVAQVQHSVDVFGVRYLERIFTEREIAHCKASGHSAPLFAARFAAKEATMKALRRGDDAMDWRNVEVQRHPDGSCDIVLTGAARALAVARGVGALSVSMSHDGAYATAVVVGNRTERPPRSRGIVRTTPRGAYER
jgi:holo-[acyl-carrier protein] synthase